LRRKPLKGQKPSCGFLFNLFSMLGSLFGKRSNPSSQAKSPTDTNEKPQNPNEKFESRMATTPLGNAVLTLRKALKDKVAIDTEDAFTILEAKAANGGIEDVDEKQWVLNNLNELILKGSTGVRMRISEIVGKLHGSRLAEAEKILPGS
jgi:hypothetical protein